jgi:hypothetical protein
MAHRSHSGRVRHRSLPRRVAARISGLAGLALAAAVIVGSGVIAFSTWGPYGQVLKNSPGIRRQYDPNGQLTLIVYDAHGRHRPDTWSYFDRGRVVRTEVDEDGDGAVDTWYYYDAAGNVMKTGFSTKHDDTVDAWRFEDADGALVKVEYSAKRDGRITRTEFYAGNVVTRVVDDLGGPAIH